MPDDACLEKLDARRRAGDRLSAWLVDAEPVISAPIGIGGRGACGRTFGAAGAGR